MDLTTISRTEITYLKRMIKSVKVGTSVPFGIVMSLLWMNRKAGAKFRPYFGLTESEARQGAFGKDNAGSEFFFIPGTR
jgi:hypothetical protein